MTHGDSEKEAHRRDTRLSEIKQILNERWDPIGVSGVVDDEYDAYVWPIYCWLRDGMESNALAKELDNIVVERMGLNASSQSQVVAEALRSAFDSN